MKSSKSGFVLFLLVFCALIIGGFLGEFFKDNTLLGFLGWGFPIGTNKTPLAIDLKTLQFTLGFSITVTFSSIISLIAAVYIYTKM